MVKIFMMTHKEFDAPKNPIYVPLHVGRAAAKRDLGYLGDDTGDNISRLNCYYAELSGIYWVWKNCHDADTVGVCHYRRILVKENGSVFLENDYKTLCDKYDIMTTKRLELPSSYREGFAAHHNAAVPDETGRVIRKLHPSFYDTYATLLEQNKTYFGNIMVAKKEIYDEYCDWLFSILFELQKRVDLSGFEDDYHRRIFGFISEFLLYVWVQAKGLCACECRVAVVGEKKETAEIENAMRGFFAKRDVAGARKYFEEYLKKRPDVIMEAADVTGECKLCLQAVSTAGMELSQYGHCFLDNMNDYDEIIEFFRRLNRAAAGYVKAAGIAKAEYAKTMESEDYDGGVLSQASDIAIQAAIRLYAKDGDAARAAFRDIKRWD